MGGITNIEWENRLGEISLIIAPKYQGRNLGSESVDLLIKEAFERMNLKTVFGECYKCNPATGFWNLVIAKYNAYSTVLPNTKYFDGRYHDSLYFSITNPNSAL